MQIHAIIYPTFSTSTTTTMTKADSNVTPLPSPLPSDATLTNVTALCFGTGRFLRSVLVPALVQAHHTVALIQPRGTSMQEYLSQRLAQQSSSSDDDKDTHGMTYEVDTVHPDGTIVTEHVPIAGCYSMGHEQSKQDFFQDLPKMTKGISLLGVGVTEAGLAHKDTQAMIDLFGILCAYQPLQPSQSSKLVVIDMDNVPNNGTKIQEYMLAHATATSNNNNDMIQFLKTRVLFCNTMVDRITSSRPGSQGMVPQCEPLPLKALVIGDYENYIKQETILRPDSQPGILLRPTPAELQKDLDLKLLLANGTHTAIAHTLSLLGHTMTNVLSDPNQTIFMEYLESLVQNQIIPACTTFIPSTSAGTRNEEAEAVWLDWKQRLMHPHFGLSAFFITQNGAAKGGIRWGPTMMALLAPSDENIVHQPPQISFALAYAVLLRWLTSVHMNGTADGIYRGYLNGFDPATTPVAITNSTDATNKCPEYADGLCYDPQQGWYDFRCPLSDLIVKLHTCLETKAQPKDCREAVRYYLTHEQGGNLTVAATTTTHFEELVDAIAVLYARMIAGDNLLDILQELKTSTYGICFTSPCSVLMFTTTGVSPPTASTATATRPLQYRPHSIPDSSCLLDLPVTLSDIDDIVTSEVQSVVAVDLHTHLLPPSHGPLCLWGIDELLTYHYLVAEYFMTAPPSILPEDFYALSKQEQADLIWKALFLDRSPLSEACRGVLTTLTSLGLQEHVRRRDLSAIRDFYASYRDQPDGSEEFSEMVFSQAGIEYAIMTNIPFSQEEARFWKPSPTTYSRRYRSALRVDPLLAGDYTTIEASLLAAGYEMTLEGARQYLLDWCDTMHPEYMMASTPHDMVVRDDNTSLHIANPGINREAMKQPGAFAMASYGDRLANCDGVDDQAPSVIDESSDFLSEVLMKVCEERDLPLALKIGAQRGLNPRLKAAGDGMVAFCDGTMLARLCSRFPKVRFLATFLSRNNQHEACVLANKFRNLHIYGCWWYCNNPSIIREITAMRIEMLGTAFTAQHSDARVLDQLLYKWPHSRAVIAQVLVGEYRKSLESGWSLTQADIRRDVRRLFRGSYEEFMTKSLL